VVVVAAEDKAHNRIVVGSRRQDRRHSAALPATPPNGGWPVGCHSSVRQCMAIFATPLGCEIDGSARKVR